MIPQAVIRNLGNGSACYAIKGLQRFWQTRRKQLIWHWGRLWWQPCGRAEPEGDWSCSPAKRGAGLRLEPQQRRWAATSPSGAPAASGMQTPPSRSLCDGSNMPKCTPSGWAGGLVPAWEWFAVFLLRDEDTFPLPSLEGVKLPSHSLYRALPFCCCPVPSGL